MNHAIPNMGYILCKILWLGGGDENENFVKCVSSMLSAHGKMNRVTIDFGMY